MDRSFLENIETPFFFFDQEVLSKEIDTLKRVLNTYWDNSIIAYSVKTNSLPFLGLFLKTKGIYAEIVSEDEFNLVRRIGYDYDKIISNGPFKTKKWLAEVLDNEAKLNIDSKREVEFVRQYAESNFNKRVNVGIRINLDVESAFPGETVAGCAGSRFGFSNKNKELANIIDKLKSKSNIKITGLHLHLSTKSRSIAVYKWLCQEFACIVRDYKLTDIMYFDIGGGFNGGLPTKPGWEEYISSISKELKNLGFFSNKLKLIIEPGVSLLAESFSYYSKVVDVKKIDNKNIVLFDGSRIHIDPFFHKQSYFYEFKRLGLVSSREIVLQELVGCTCLEKDRFFCIETELALQNNDMICFHKIGAYTLTLSPLFISFFPAVYLRKKNGEIECIRKKWGVDEFIQGSKIE